MIIPSRASNAFSLSGNPYPRSINYGNLISFLLLVTSARKGNSRGARRNADAHHLSGSRAVQLYSNVSIERRPNTQFSISCIVPASSTKIVDTVPLSKFHRLEYGLQYHDAAGPKTRSLKLVVVKDDTSVDDQVFAKQGNTINAEVNAKVTGSNFQLEIINNETFSLDLSLARLTL